MSQNADELAASMIDVVESWGSGPDTSDNRKRFLTANLEPKLRRMLLDADTAHGDAVCQMIFEKLDDYDHLLVATFTAEDSDRIVGVAEGLSRGTHPGLD